LEKVFEKVSSQNLKIFFKQWLNQPGQPMLAIQWNYDTSKKLVSLKIEQTQDYLFEFPLLVSFSDGKKIMNKEMEIKNKVTQLKFSLPFKPTRIVVDPDVNLLYDLQQINK
jgi:aminopeptidase N